MFSLFSFQINAAISCRTRQTFASGLLFSQGMAIAWLMVHPKNAVKLTTLKGSLQFTYQPKADGMTPALLVHLSQCTSVFRRFCHESVS
jgi:hypothetical protein